LIVTEIAVHRSAGENQIVKRPLAVGSNNRVGVVSDRQHLVANDTHIALPRKNAADGGSDVRRAQPRHRDLIKQRLKQVIVASVNQRDIEIAVLGKPFCCVQSGKTTADDDNSSSIHRRSIVFRQTESPSLRGLFVDLRAISFST